MSEENSIIKLVDHLYKTCHIQYKGRKVYINDINTESRLAPKKLADNLASDLPNLAPFLDIPENTVVSFDVFQSRITNKLPLIAQEIVKRNAKELGMELDGGTDLTEIVKGCYPVVNLLENNSKDLYFMINKDTQRVENITYKAWEAMIGRAGATEFVQSNGLVGTLAYNPRDTAPFRIGSSTESGKPIKVYNAYYPPGHRLKRNKTAVLDPFIIKAVETFFLNDQARLYAYNWMYASLYGRVTPYLVFVGAGGTGKNLIGRILTRLHGERNSAIIPETILKSQFNSSLENITFAFYDECKFSNAGGESTQAKNRLKAWAEKHIPVERKGRDVVQVENFASALITTNHSTDVWLEQKDRKFSVVEITDKRLETRIPKDEINRIWAIILEDPEFPDAFLNYLEQFVDPNFNPHKEYKGEKFEELVLTSLHHWQRTLLEDYIKNPDKKSDGFYLKDLRETIDNFPKGTAKINDFLKNFTDSKGEVMGGIVKREGQTFLRVNDKYVPPERSLHDLDKLL